MKTYLFDFDGTLVDSMPAFVAFMLKILDENNVSYTDDIVKTITPLGTLGTAKYFVELGLKLSVDEILKKMYEYAIYEYTYNIQAKNNVIEVIKKLKEDGASLNILTASPHITLDVCLKRIGIYNLFDNVWSCDDFNTNKTDVNIYKLAADRMGVAVGEVLFLDDNLNADKTAKDAGMKVCGVYDESSAEYTEEIKKVCDYYICDFKELLKIDF